MILSFSTKWPKGMPDYMAGKPNYFTEKIWAGLIYNDPSINVGDYEKYTDMFYKKFEHDFTGYKNLFIYPKPHTIRRDEKDRWKAGNDIHFAINVRTKNQFQFAPVVKCVSTQIITIKHNDPIQRDNRFKKSHVWIDGGHSECIWKDGVIVNCAYTIEQLVRNDGFDSVDDFFAWFNEDFTGKIIHWTDFKY